MTRALLLLLAPFLLTACKRQDMYTQDRAQTWDRSTLYADHASMRAAPQGTVPRDIPDPSVPQPATITAALLDRGEQRYEVFCTPCHGSAGHGDGMIVQRGFTQPPSLVEGQLRQVKAQLIYDTITNGYGAMYSYADRVPSADRWAIAAYIRALQLSQSAEVATLPPDDKARLESLR